MSHNHAMKTLIEGLETSYQKMGTGIPVLLLHGWGCDWQIWHPIISRFSDEFQLVIPDLPAFGESHVPSEVWSSREYLLWLESFIKEIIGSNQDFIMIGHSFGGKLAALYAAQKPASHLKKLVIVDASGLPDPLTNKQQLRQLLIKHLPSALKNMIPPHRRATWLKALGIASDHAVSHPQQRAILRRVIKENIANQIVKITTPTLLLWGEKDTDTPMHQARQFSKLISGSQLISMSGSGHFPFIDEPGQFMSYLQDFLLS